ncbi:hypothetical protein D9619_011803 [Psilocybe cf. subviscida]|uniref:Uncharacterized protein n=1 Tax=Psilocybe cf. subviscida TaxID=2480587 RepID=A0A8H5EVW0_9AGAR|nr:hypothetical protein D9619_011803 [Psilocybe cf. subviscida]
MSFLASNTRSATGDVQEPPPDPEHQDQQREASESDNMLVVPTGMTDDLPAQSKHSSRDVRLVYNALAAVVLGPLPVSDWDGNDYYYMEMLARDLENGVVPLSDLTWDPATGWAGKKAFATEAVCAYMADEWSRVQAGNDEDAKAAVASDHAFLRTIFRLHDKENPFADFDEAQTEV